MMLTQRIFSRFWPAMAAGVVAFGVGLMGRAEAESLRPVPISQVTIEDAFWSPKIETWRTVTIPDCWGKFEKDGALTNFDRVRDGDLSEHFGPPWYDGLIYEMIRASADFLAEKPDAALEARLDGYIARIAGAAAKDPDGYVNTYTEMKEPSHRWGMNGGNDVWQHDCYNAGALIDAGVHYYRATGKTELLKVAVKLANGMCALMGPPPKHNVIPGHAIGEEALVNLYRLFKEQPELKARMASPVREDDYLGLAQFWLEARGNHQGRRDFLAYAQDDQPLLKRNTIDGHAVRAVLLCAGLAAAADVNQRADYLAAAQRLWESMTGRRMYVTGGLGAMANDEKFAVDYTLPNKGYLETCAAVGGAFFDENMNTALGGAKYADEVERELFNGALVGVSLQGNSYFYDNPLEVDDKHERWSWHPCPCCPPMFLKLMAALPGYIYAQGADGIYVNQFIGSRTRVTMDGTRVALRQVTGYPWKERVRLEIEPEHPAKFAVYARLPGWRRGAGLSVNGRELQNLEQVNGYARVEREWKRGDFIELTLPMPVERVKADPRVTDDFGRVALRRGPVVYCVEAMDNGGEVKDLALPGKARLKAEYRPDLLGGVVVIEGEALDDPAWAGGLYAAEPGAAARKVEFMAIPYYANANRQPGPMEVWLTEAD